jgi:pantetheine-phosphate adenylyltransferase
MRVLVKARLRTASTSPVHVTKVWWGRYSPRSSEKRRNCPWQPKLYPSNPGPKGRDLSRSARPYKLVALGGTFDVLHAGHRHLLSEAFKLGDVVLIGVTSDRLVVALHKKHQVRSFSSRVRELNRFLKTRRWASRARITALQEACGPAASRKKLQALIVSKSTLARGRRLNRLRRQNGLKSLDLFVVDLLKAADGKPISTTRIKSGEIDLQGRVLKTRR